MTEKADKSKAKNEETANDEKPSGSLWNHFLKALPLMILGLVFVFFINRQGLISELGNVVLDTQMILNTPAEKSKVVIIDINAEDFKNIFNQQTRPLKPDALHKLISAISAGKPCIIGVDIFTNYDGFSAKNFTVDEKNWSPVIWVRDTIETSDDVSVKPIPVDVLGGQSQYNADSGLSYFFLEGRTVRFYQREIETQSGKLPSFDRTIFQKAAAEKCAGINFPNLEANTNQYFINFSRGKAGAERDRVSASLLLKLSQNEDWKENNLVKDKIVLIGSSYLNEDIHNTPFGAMPGVEVHANIIETELQGGGVEPPGFLANSLLAFFDGFILVALFHIFSGWRAFFYSLLVIVVLSLLCSLVMYYSLAYWAFFAPVMLGVLLTELWDKVKDLFKGRYKEEIKVVAGKIEETYFQEAPKDIEAAEPTASPKAETKPKKRTASKKPKPKRKQL